MKNEATIQIKSLCNVQNRCPFLVVDKIPSLILQFKFRTSHLQLASNIKLSNPEFNKPANMDIRTKQECLPEP